jgi:hypothetical protein
LKVIRTPVSLKASSMSCRNPKTEISAKNCETLGPKIQNYWKCNLKVVGGALKEVVHSYEIFSPNVSVEGVETTQKERVVLFLEILGGLYDSAEKRMGCLKACAMDSFKTYALVPC